MKKVALVMLMIALIFSFGVTNAFAATPIEFNVTADKADAEIGDVVTFTVSVAGTNGSNLAVMSFNLDIPEDLEYQSHEVKCSDKFNTSNYNQNANNFAAFGASGINDDQWDVMTVTCKVRETSEPGSKTVSIKNDDDLVANDNEDSAISVTPGNTVLKVTGTISGEQNIAITAPVKGNAPQDTIAEGSGYTGAINWVPAVSNSNFDASTVYTAQVTLTAKEFYKFAADTTVTVAGAEKINNLTVAEDGATLFFDAVFPATEAKVVTGLEITTAPTKVAYVEGENFDPTGMVVKATFEDNSVVDDYKDYVVENGDNLQKGTTAVTIKAGDVTDTQEITVSCNHSLTDVAAKEATCIAKGWDAYKTCSKCGQLFAADGTTELDAVPERAIDPTNHAGGTEVKNAVEETCGADGYTGDTYCKDCAVEIAKGSAIPATGKHTAPNEWLSGADNHWQKCTVCKQEINKAAHSFAWVIDKAATEDETGLKHEECTVCKKVQSENTVIDKLDHVHVGIVYHEAVAATCIAKGTVEYWSCSSPKCDGKYYVDAACTNELATIVTSVDSTNHAGDTEVKGAVEETCGTDGYTGDTYCKDCNVEIAKGSIIPATGKHDNSGEWIYDETNHWKECAVCDEVIEEAAHTLKWVVDTPATEDATGIQHQECECGYKTAAGTVVDKLPHVHDMVQHAAVAATCVDTGIAEYWTCSNDKCEGVYYANEEGSATLDTIETDIDPTNHVGGTEVKDAIEATCGADGYTGDTYCLSCGEKIADGKTIAATGKYSFGEWVQTIAPTETAKGEKERVCSVCKHKETAEIPMLKPSTGGSSGGGFSGVYNYPVKVDDVDGATVSFDKTNAVAGDKVIITVTPDNGKQVDEVIITDTDDEVIAVTKVGDNKYSFIMPESKVNVTVTTEKADYDTRVVLQIGNRNVVNGNKTFTNDVAPVIVDNRTMVPIRVITEALGGKADWNAAARTVTLTVDGKVLRMTINQTIAGFDAAPVIINSRTYVPIRYVAEALGANVEWIADTQQIIIEK